MKHRRLQELDRSDFEIVDGEPDIRGWDVKNQNGNKIGEVEELIVDAQQKKVRYMVVDLDDNELKLDHRKVLLPIGMAQLHRDDDDVILPNIQETQLSQLPDYDEDHLNAEVERRICGVLGRKDTAITTSAVSTEELPQDFYVHEYYNADNLYKNRLHEATPAKTTQQSEHEKGLRLWERRSEGGLLSNPESDTGTSRRSTESRVNDEARMEMVKNRRQNYEQRRGGLGRDHDGTRHDSIERRIRDEGLRDG